MIFSSWSENLYTEDRDFYEVVLLKLEQKGFLDNTAPVPGNGGLVTAKEIYPQCFVAGECNNPYLQLNWNKAFDEVTSQSDLIYQVKYFKGDIALEDAVWSDYGSATKNMLGIEIRGLAIDTLYTFKVIVADEAGNQAQYQTVSKVYPYRPELNWDQVETIADSKYRSTSRNISLALMSDSLEPYILTSSGLGLSYGKKTFVLDDSTENEWIFDHWVNYLNDSLIDHGTRSGLEMKIDRNNEPHLLFYSDYFKYDSTFIDFKESVRLRHAKWDSSNEKWNISVIDDDLGDFYSFRQSLFLDGNLVPHVCYYNKKKSSFVYAKWTPAGWEKNVLGGIKGDYFSMLIDSEKKVHVVYYEDDYLYYARYEDNHWRLSNIAELVRKGDITAAMALNSKNEPYVIFTDNYEHLSCAKLNISNNIWVWEVEKVDNSGEFYFPVIKFDNIDRPHLLYFSQSNKIKYAVKNNDRWDFSVVATNFYIPGLNCIPQPLEFSNYFSLAIDYNNNPHIAYCPYSEKVVKYLKLAP